VKNIAKILLSAFLFLPVNFCAAQTQQQPLHAPDGGTRETFASIFIPSMPNAPFTATVNTEWIRQLPDGSNITLKNHRTIARDAQGRVFQERRYFVPDDGKRESMVTQIEISDPASHEQYICMPRERVCRLQHFVARQTGRSRRGKSRHTKHRRPRNDWHTRDKSYRDRNDW
jgi:hypothetical protein